ncbi:MAG: type II toxin-antitoxin system RelE/ParE family toxin [Chloroflexi bacterium]|nr:type II toxin-antitoxin system RelE/ParE family toxin [Chloroflexota bacterium]
MEIRFLEIAERELEEAVTYYNLESPGLGDEFLLQFLNALERIRQYSEAWQRFSQNTRRCRVNRFPWGVIYEILESEILVVAVAHLHRDPGYWQNRIP